jgi:hypothetical protein
MPKEFPEFWKCIHFGEKLDSYGGLRGPEVLRTGVTVSEDIGRVNYLTSEKGYDVLAEDAGIALFYQKNGLLNQAGFDVETFIDACDEEEEEKMGGKALKEILDMAVEDNHQISVCVDWETKTAALEYIDNESGESEVLSSFEGLVQKDIHILRAKLGEYFLNAEIRVVEDVLYFGILALPEGEKITEDTKILMSRVLIDCNFETFLGSDSLDKYNKLTKRIFFLND